MRALRQLGARVALDGFGRGATSLRGLQLGLLSTLKLAPEMLERVPEDGPAAAVAGALLELGRNLGLRVVAEGVDRQAQLSFLRRHGCSAVQAFMSCPPLAAEACTRWLAQATARGVRPAAEAPRALAAPLPQEPARTLAPVPAPARRVASG